MDKDDYSMLFSGDNPIYWRYYKTPDQFSIVLKKHSIKRLDVTPPELIQYIRSAYDAPLALCQLKCHIMCSTTSK